MKNKYSKRDPIKDYFPLPNEIFFIGLSYGEIAVYAYLLYRENRETFQCYPSYKTIGEALKMSRNTVSKYVRRLEERELISTQSSSIFTKDNKKLNGNLLYTILPIERAKQYFYKQQLNKIDQMITDRKRKERLEKLNLKPKEETA
ncbi:MAG TPA: helix-turn-helix domain-containing protein [Ruminococcaceae bacterium]|nr:helix-turn-helix domain-containing protein [Oscillospiraceae bacterium]